jgi:transposase
MGVHDVPFTVREAAGFFNVERPTVWAWIRRYKLEPVGRREHEPGKPKEYRFGDLAEAERFARRSRGRHRYVNPEKFG